MTVADYFEASNTIQESNADEDLGSGGALVLPDLTDANGTVHHLALGAGKDSIGYYNYNGSDLDQRSLLEAGAIECLLKPFSESALLDAVTRALRR